MKKNIYILFMTIVSFMAIGFDIYAYYTKGYTELLKIGILPSVLLCIMLYKMYVNYKKKKNIVISTLSALFTFFMVFGNSYLNLGNANLVFGGIKFFILSVIAAIGYYFLFHYALEKLFDFLDKNKFKDTKKKLNKFFTLFEEHPFLFSFIFILICYLPYIISFYPIIMSPDPSFQIKQFFNIPNKYSDYAVLLDKNVILTNHHPVTHTLLLGGCLNLGHILGSDNLGLFFYSIIQILVLLSVFSLTIYYMKKLNISIKYRFIALLIYALVPLFPLYAMSAVKDVLFSAFVLLYIMIIHNIVTKKCENMKIWHYLGMVILMLLIILFRNNGLHMIILSFPFVILTVKSKWKQLLSVFASVLILSNIYSNVLLPHFKITPGSIREMLSIPFQQTARYVKYHDEDVTKKEKKIIDKILGYETLAERYDPELSDPVKNEFNKYTTDEDLKEYFKIWFNGFLKQPVTYIDATINNVYGFFYPEKLNWYIYYGYNDTITEDGFDYHYNSLGLSRELLAEFGSIFPRIPIIGLLANAGFTVWVVFILIGYCIYKKWYSTICNYIPAFVLILVCVAGPANTYFRYILPVVFMLPFLVACLIDKINTNKQR